MADDKEENVKTNGEAKPENKENGNDQNECKNSEMSNLEERIVHQIEYYFGDINMPKDKFLLEQIKLDDGWIPMSTMLTFQRLAKLTNDPKVIAKALEHSDLIEVDESGDEIKIRRTPDRPLPELNDENYKELQSRSIYCKGFPLDYTMNDLIDFFTQYGQFENIIMRKYKDKLSRSYVFKGSVFVTFADKEKAKKFLDIESVKCKDKELIRKWQLDYIEEKKKEIMENKLQRSKKASEAACDEKEVKENFPRGATLHLKGEFNQISREDIKEKFNNLGFETAFIAFNKGEEEAHVRLNRENAGKEFLESQGKDLEIGKCKMEARLLEGEEEETFLKKALEDRNAYFKKCHQARQGGRKGKGRGGRNSRKRKGSVEETESAPAKKALETK